MRSGLRLGRLIVTTCRQPGGQPIIDGGMTYDAAGRRYGSWTIRLRSTPGRALTIGWRDALVPAPRRPRWLFGFRP